MTQFQSAPVPQPAQQPDPQMLSIMQLTKRVSSGANNFYLVAALSVVNTLLSIFSAGRYFVIGLAASLIVDAIFTNIIEMYPDAQLIAKLLDVAISVVIAGVFALFGYFASKGKRWAFITGMVFYTLDALLMLVLQEWIGLLFHVFFLWGMFGGLQALNQLQKLLPKKEAVSEFPQNIGVS